MNTIIRAFVVTLVLTGVTASVCVSPTAFGGSLTRILAGPPPECTPNDCPDSHSPTDNQ